MHIRILSVLVAILIMGACVYDRYDKTQEEKIVIGVFAESNWDVPSGTPHDILQDAIDVFHQRHPDVKVTFVSGIPKAEYPEWLAGKLLAGDEPDVFIIPSAEVSTYISVGALADLDVFMENDLEFNADAYYPAAVSMCQQNGLYYALPVECSPSLMFVNKTLLARENIPMPSNNWSWNDFYTICEKVTKDRDGDGSIDQYGCYGYNWKYASLTNGMDIFDDQGASSYFSDSRLEEAIFFVMSLRELNRGYEVSNKDFDLGNVAFRPFTFAEYRTYLPYPWRIKKYTAFEWDVVPFPAGPKGSNTSIMNVMLMGMSTRTKHPDLAWEFLKLLSYDKEIQLDILAKSQGLPVRRDILADPESQQIFDQAVGEGTDQMPLAVINDIMEHSVAEKNFKQYQEVLMIADTNIQKVINGTLPLNNTLNRLQKEVNTYLDR